jgi:hypothetical protein
MWDEHGDLEGKVNPRRIQTFSPNNVLDMIMPTYPASGSTMFQRRMVSF